MDMVVFNLSTAGNIARVVRGEKIGTLVSSRPDRPPDPSTTHHERGATVINDTLNEADAKMGKSVEATREDFAAIRTGRAQPGMFDKITADYYGTPTPLQQLASFTAPEARTIIIQPFDIGAMGAIERAIRDSDLGVNPTDDGSVLRCVFPS